MKRGKKAIVTEYLPWIIISVEILVIILVVIFSLKTQGISLIDKLKILFKI